VQHGFGFELMYSGGALLFFAVLFVLWVLYIKHLGLSVSILRIVAGVVHFHFGGPVTEVVSS